MEWLSELFFEPSYLQTVLIIAVISAVGLALGKIRFRRVSLGVAFVFFAGIFFGDLFERLGLQSQEQMLQFAQNFGLILFVYSLGVQVGPGFFTSLRKGGLKINMYAMLAVVLTTLTSIILFFSSSISFSDLMGLFSGAVTNTPMLGAAQQSLLEIHPDAIQDVKSMASACAVGYPVGVLGVLISMIVFRYFTRGKDLKPEPHSETYICEFHISNPAIFGRKIEDINKITPNHFIISRIWKSGKVIIPSAQTILEKGDHIMVVLNRADVDKFKIIFGQEESTDWNRQDIDWDNIDNSNLVSKHVFVTKDHLNGVKIGSLHLRNSFDINITRVLRAGMELVAYPNLVLQLGDRLTIVGTEAAIKKVGEILGNEEKELGKPNLVTVFVGIVLGILLGMIPISLPGISIPVKLGIAGGPLVVGILMGAFGPRLHLAIYSTRSANLMIRQIGLVMYLACLGFSAGHGFVRTVFCMEGLIWMLFGLLISTLPILVCAWIQTRFGKMDYARTAGTLCAAMANPMALTYVNSNTDENEASEAYATAYPLSMFIRVISTQLLMLLFV